MQVAKNNQKVTIIVFLHTRGKLGNYTDLEGHIGGRIAKLTDTTPYMTPGVIELLFILSSSPFHDLYSNGIRKPDHAASNLFSTNPIELRWQSRQSGRFTIDVFQLLAEAFV